VSLQCLADNAALSSVTLLLSISPVNTVSLSTVDFPDDVFLRLCVAHASEKSDAIRVAVSVLDFVRFVLIVCSLINVHCTPHTGSGAVMHCD